MSNPFASSADVEKHFNKSRSSQEQQYTSSSFQEPYINDVSRDYKLGGTSNINVDAIDASEKKVKRELKPRVVSMMALGGTIGTGLFLNIATPLSEAGPVNALISYVFVGTIVYGVTQSLGEMATYIPESASFTVYGRRMLSRSYGFASGYMYWFNWVITLAVELSVVGQVIQYWTYDVPLWAWILIFWVVLTIANLSPVKYYGEIEFWIACIKVIAIIGFLIYALCMVCGAGKTGPVGFRYWRNPGPWGPGKTSTKRFLGWVNSLINAIFTYQGTELVGVTAGEAKNPKKSVPKAINTVFYRIILFYIGSLFFLGLLVPYNDPKLSSTESYIAASPFVIAMNNAGTKILPDIFNAVVLTTVLSAANSNIYTSSRVLYALAELNIAPKIFSRCNKVGVPVYSVLFSSLFGALGFMSCTTDGNNAFNWLIQISAVAGLFAWLGISFCHIRFMQAIKYRGMSRDDLPFKAKLMPFFAYYSAFFVFILIFVQGYAVFMDFNAKDFFINYISVIIFFVVYIGHQVITRHKPLLSIEEVDVTTGVRTVEEEEEDLLEEEKEREEGSKISRIFNNFF